MIRIASIITMFFFIGVLTSCNENKKTNDIITRKPEKTHVKKSIQKIGDYEQTRTVDWHGSVYNVSIERKADVNLPLVDDGTGNKYYDNRIRLCLTGRDGKELLRRDFTKDDFRKYVGDEYAKNNVLLGVVFDRVATTLSHTTRTRSRSLRATSAIRGARSGAMWRI